MDWLARSDFFSNGKQAGQELNHQLPYPKTNMNMHIL